MSLRSRFTRQRFARVVAILPLSISSLFLCGIATGILGLGTSAVGEEPAQEFLARLRDAGYFDTAIAYLDRTEKMAGINPSFLEAIPLEKAQTFIDAAVSSRSSAERDQQFVSAQTQLKEFLTRTEHPRLSEARLLLGKLQMVRGGQMLAAKKPNTPTEEARKNARDSYMEAAATFDSIVADLLKVLEGMKGQRIDAEKEPEKAAQRSQYQFEFLQAKMRGAEARELGAKTFAKPAEEGKPLMEEALKAFTDLSEKYDDYPQGALAMTARGKLQRDLGKTAEAIDSFQRVMEQVDVDALRGSKMEAAAALIDLWIAANPPRLDDAIRVGQTFVDDSRANESRLQEMQDLKVALARAYIANNEALAAAGGKPAEEKRAKTNARQLLIEVSKISGPHEELAKELLAKVGIEKGETEEPVATTNIKSLDEALAAARDFLLSIEELEKMSSLLAEQKKTADNPEAVDGEIKSIASQMDEKRLATTEVLRRGLAFDSKDPGLLNQARQYLAYSLYQRGYFYESAVVGDYLARSAPSDSIGLRGGLLSLSSLQSLLQDANDEQTVVLTKQIETLGAYLTSQWPDDPQAASAKGIMIRLALNKDRWEDAKKLLADMPDGEEKSTFKRLMGQLIWNRSLLLRQEKKDAEADALLPDASVVLREGLDQMPGELLGPEVLQAALVLAKIELRLGNHAVALAVLDHAKYGPLAAVEKQGEPSDGYKSDLYSAELQAVVGVMTADGSDTQKLLERATGVMGRLQDSVKGKDDASGRLVRIYLGMAKDIREQLTSATPDRKEKLIGAFRVFLESIAKSSEDPSTLQWVGQTLMQMGETSMNPGELRAQGQAKELLATSITTLDSLITKQGAEATPALKYQLAKAYRLNGEYKRSLDLLETVLQGNPMMLDAQVEAATAYEQWAGSIDPKFAAKAYGSALGGARPGKDGKNVIWGWGRVSKLVSGREEFRDTFFDARYHVALCRYLMGKSSKNNAVMEQAISDISQVASLYPDLGGVEKRAQFDLLMKEIQKSLGKKPDGLPVQAAAAGKAE